MLLHDSCRIASHTSLLAVGSRSGLGDSENSSITSSNRRQADSRWTQQWPPFYSQQCRIKGGYVGAL